MPSLGFAAFHASFASGQSPRSYVALLKAKGLASSSFRAVLAAADDLRRNGLRWERGDRRRAAFLVTTSSTTKPSGANEASPILYAVDAAGVAFAMAQPIRPDRSSTRR